MAFVERKRPQFNEREAMDLARSLYRVSGIVKELPSERDQNFHIRDDSGKEFVLKIASTLESEETLDMQNKAMEHVAARTDFAFTQRICRSTQNNQMVAVVDSSGEPHFVRMLTYLQGIPFAQFRPHSNSLLRNLGKSLGFISQALSGFDHPASRRDLRWDFDRVEWVVTHFGKLIPEGKQSDLVLHFLNLWRNQAKPAIHTLRKSVVYHDANDYNILVFQETARDEAQIRLIDFGDMLYTYTLAEAAIGAAYAMLEKQDPLSAATEVVRGFHEIFPLTEEEIRLLFHFMTMRLCLSVCICAYQKQEEPENEYLKISEMPAWETLEKLKEIHSEFASNRLREACNQEPHPDPGNVQIRGREESSVETRRLLERRKKHISKSLSISYQSPLNITRGKGQYLYDESGRAYLDCVNNVAHVGHCHPRVIEAAVKQWNELNTNTRYLHRNIVDYAERLCASFPEPLNVCFFVCSGSEANDLALRLARAYTGCKNTVVLESAYHGNLSSLIEISPHKFDGPGGSGAPQFVRKTMLPDLYRGPYKREMRDAGMKYAEDVRAQIESFENSQPVTFIVESAPGCAGQIILPQNYMERAFRFVRDRGGVCIADEVQVGFGRVGSHFWCFQTQNVVPDIVTLGKPIGNGHPLAAVITTPTVAAAFENGMEYFNSFGGNPVSCAVGMAVLDVIEQENLQLHALEVGNYLKSGLTSLMDRHLLIGDVRGLGLFLGLELVTDRKSLNPAAREASCVIERMKERNILLSTDGPHHNVIKIKPPMVFTKEDADCLVQNLDFVLSECR